MALRRRRRPRRSSARRTWFTAALVLLGLYWFGADANWIAAESDRTDKPASPTPSPSPSSPARDRAAATPVTPATAPTAPTTPSTAPATRIPTVAVDPQSVWASRQACDSAIGDMLASPRPTGARIASWNLHWFPNGRARPTPKVDGTDVLWMACAMASLRADVIAVQEVTTTLQARRALNQLIDRLDALTGGQWRSHLDDCNGDNRQHLGFLYDSTRVQFTELPDVAALNPNRSACAGGLRPGVQATIRIGDQDLRVVTVHLDSGDENRDYKNRLRSVERLVGSCRKLDDPPLLALGDFNTMGCAKCDPPETVSHEEGELINRLRDTGLHMLQLPNNALACSQHFAGKPVWLDRAITNLPTARASLHLAGLCADLACQRPRTTSAALAHLSDHCPIVVEIAPRPAP